MLNYLHIKSTKNFCYLHYFFSQPERLQYAALFAMNRAQLTSQLELIPQPPEFALSLIPASPALPLAARICRSFADRWQGGLVPFYRSIFQRLYTRFTGQL